MASFVCDFTIRAYSVDFDHTFSTQIGSREASRSVLHRSQEVGPASQEVSLMLE